MKIDSDSNSKENTRMTIEKFSKPSVAVIKNKTSFFLENAKHLNYVLSVNEVYIQQPQRNRCKNCDNPITGKDFISHNVPYVVCDICNHLNGVHEDSEAFSEFLYTEDGGANYKENYLNSYDARVADIYIPKVEFMLEVLGKYVDINNLSVLDVGCGGGHFIKACGEKNINAVGLEPNQALVEMGNEKLGENRIELCTLNDINKIILNSEHDVISMIGVMEHLRYPRVAMQAFRDSKAKYMYLQVPLFSLSVLLEHINQEVFPRQLNAGHTHLYTNQSLKYLFDEFGLKGIGEWWFGTDMVDMFRQLIIKSKPVNKDKMNFIIDKYLGSMIDELQHVLDSHKLCSGVNIVITKI